MKPVQTIRCKSFSLSRLHLLEQDGSWIFPYRGTKLIDKKNYNTQGFLFFFFRRRSVGKVTPPVWSTLLVLHRSEPAALASVSDVAGRYTK